MGTVFNFKKFSDKKPIGDLNDYIEAYRNLNGEDFSIYVAADSQAKGDEITWAVVVILHNKSRGGHILFHKERAKRKLFGKAAGRDYEKLFREAQLALEVAEVLSLHNNEVTFIGLDYNEDKDFFSNSVLRDTIGWIKGYGYNVVGKPNPFVYAANIGSRQTPKKRIKATQVAFIFNNKLEPIQTLKGK